MWHRLLRSSPVIESSSSRSVSFDLLSQIWRSANYQRPDTEFVSLRRRVSHFLRCAPHLDTFRDWFGNPKHQALQQALAEREAELEQIASVFMADPAFAQCREDEKLWEVTVGDGLEGV